MLRRGEAAVTHEPKAAVVAAAVKAAGSVVANLVAATQLPPVRRDKLGLQQGANVDVVIEPTLGGGHSAMRIVDHEQQATGLHRRFDAAHIGDRLQTMLQHPASNRDIATQAVVHHAVKPRQAGRNKAVVRDILRGQQAHIGS